MAFAQLCSLQRNQRSRLFRLCSALFVVLTVVTGCNSTPVVDLPSSDLDVKITVLDIDANPSGDTVRIIVQFFSNGEVVELDSNATVTCNGTAMIWQDFLFGYAEHVPIETVGGTYNCTHSRNGMTTTASVTVPGRPVFVSPTAGATVTRSNNLTITYVAGSGTGIRVSASAGSDGIRNDVQSDNGTYTGLDVSSLNAGPGEIDLTREFLFTLTGTGFHSAEVNYSSGSEIDITWT